MIIDKRRYKDFDMKLLVITCVVFLMGALTLYSATQAKNLPFDQSFLVKQVTWFFAGFAVSLLLTRISYYRFIDAAYFLYAANVLLLILVLVMGHTRLGAQRWFSIAGFAFQPSEFMKITLILALSAYVGQKKDDMANLRSLIIPVIMFSIPFVLVLLQPDLGTGLLLVPLFFAIIFIGGANPKYILWMIGAGLASTPIFWHFLRGYQKQRLMVFINPNSDPLGAGYNIIQSKIAVGSGGLIGKGWLNGTQNQLNFIPEHHTDFIFSVFGEEWGFLGAIVLILLFFFIIYRAFIIADSTTDRYGKCIATGVAVLLGLQITINIAMTIGLMPVVGIPLPLVSYGGSSVLATVFAIGLLLNVGMRKSTF